MNRAEIINSLIKSRSNELTVKRVQVNLTPGSLGNPSISVGILPYYDWDKVKEPTYIITYGRYLNCEMLVYTKQIKGDKDYLIVKGTDKAVEELNNILNGIETKLQTTER